MDTSLTIDIDDSFQIETARPDDGETMAKLDNFISHKKSTV